MANSFTAPAEALAFVGRMADVHLADPPVQGQFGGIIIIPGDVRQLSLLLSEVVVSTGMRTKERPGKSRWHSIASSTATALCSCWYRRGHRMRCGMMTELVVARRDFFGDVRSSGKRGAESDLAGGFRFEQVTGAIE